MHHLMDTQLCPVFNQTSSTLSVFRPWPSQSVSSFIFWRQNFTVYSKLVLNYSLSALAFWDYICEVYMECGDSSLCSVGRVRAGGDLVAGPHFPVLSWESENWWWLGSWDHTFQKHLWSVLEDVEFPRALGFVCKCSWIPQEFLGMKCAPFAI